MIKIADAHNDFLTKKQLDFNLFENDLKKNNITLCNAILFSNDKNFNIIKATKLKEKLKSFNYLKRHTILSFENLSFLEKNEYENLVKFQPFSCSLTWNYANQFAGGALSFSALTLEGKNLIKLLNDNNIIIDTAHLNKRSFFDVAKLNKRPLLNSHTCLEGFRHHRNINFEQARIIIETNGFVGITFVSDFYGLKKISANYVFKNIDLFVQNFGIKHIGIGSDFFGTTHLPYDLKYYKDFKNLEKLFFKNGYSQNDIDRIFFKNFCYFVENNL